MQHTTCVSSVKDKNHFHFIAVKPYISCQKFKYCHIDKVWSWMIFKAGSVYLRAEFKRLKNKVWILPPLRSKHVNQKFCLGQIQKFEVNMLKMAWARSSKIEEKITRKKWCLYEKFLCQILNVYCWVKHFILWVVMYHFLKVHQSVNGSNQAFKYCMR